MDSPHTLYMAPMLGITDSAHREAFTECFGGFDCAITPFIKTLQGGRCKESKLADCLPGRNKALKIFPQLLSNNSEDFIPIAHELFEMGYDRININFGCPVPMAAGRGRGAGLLPHPDFVDRLLDEILSVIPNRLSIKTRVGFDRPDQLQAMTKVFNRYPLYEVTIHPRTALQGYGGSVDHDAFEAAVAALETPVVYSGDINSLADFVALQRRYPAVRKWMLGRGALANPLLPGMIKRHLNGARVEEERVDGERLEAFFRNFIHQLEERLYEPNVILTRLKTLFYYQAEFLGCAKQHVKAVRKARGSEEFLSLVRTARHCVG